MVKEVEHAVVPMIVESREKFVHSGTLVLTSPVPMLQRHSIANCEEEFIVISGQYLSYSNIKQFFLSSVVFKF